MPFTFAHPAAVLPFITWDHKFWVPSALVVGSMAPDFEYFCRLQCVSLWSHTPAGLFSFCLPVGLAVFWIYHVFQKELVVSWLPKPCVCERCYLSTSSPPFSFSYLLRICLSLLLGAGTHLLWDGFTHGNGFLLPHIPVLSTVLILPGGLEVRLHSLLQDLSTVVGMGMLGLAIWDALGRRPARSLFEGLWAWLHCHTYMLSFLGLAVVLSGFVLWLSVRHNLPVKTTRDVLRAMVVIAIPAIYGVSVFYGIGQKVMKMRKRSAI